MHPLPIISYCEGDPSKVKPFQCDEATDLVVKGKKKLRRKKSKSAVLTKYKIHIEGPIYIINLLGLTKLVICINLTYASERHDPI